MLTIMKLLSIAFLAELPQNTACRRYLQKLELEGELLNSKTRPPFIILPFLNVCFFKFNNRRHSPVPFKNIQTALNFNIFFVSF